MDGGCDGYKSSAGAGRYWQKVHSVRAHLSAEVPVLPKPRIQTATVSPRRTSRGTADWCKRDSGSTWQCIKFVSWLVNSRWFRPRKRRRQHLTSIVVFKCEAFSSLGEFLALSQVFGDKDASTLTRKECCSANTASNDSMLTIMLTFASPLQNPSCRGAPFTGRWVTALRKTAARQILQGG